MDARHWLTYAVTIHTKVILPYLTLPLKWAAHYRTIEAIMLILMSQWILLCLCSLFQLLHARLCTAVLVCSKCVQHRFRCKFYLHLNTKTPVFILFTARCYASAVLAMALCLSVSPSVTSRCSTKTAKRWITQTPHDSPGTLVFWRQRSPRNSTGVTTYEGAECRWGGSKSATFDIYPAISRKR